MTESDLLLLTDPTVQKIVRAWPYVDRNLRASARLESWADAAMVDPADVAKAEPALFRCGMLTEDGAINPMATQFLRLQVARSIPPAPRQAPRQATPPTPEPPRTPEAE